MRVIRVSNNTGTLQKWTVDRDSVLVGMTVYASVATRALLSFDPSLSISEIESPTSDVVREETVLEVRCASTTNVVGTIYESLKIPISAGWVAMISFSGVGTVVLFLEEPSTLS